MKRTRHYQFHLPEDSDGFDISIFNENWKKIDGILKRLKSRPLPNILIMALIIVVYKCLKTIETINVSSLLDDQ